jgi:fructose-1,6-bisphosphatase/inositol monophosphatase family enzyme
MQNNVDANKVAQILKDAALQYILPRFQNLQAGDIHTKSHANDFVTVADIETEEALCKILPAAFPGCLVIGEEGVSSGKVTTDALADPTQMIFVVDPVDGTYNFKNGNPQFAVMMALVMGGETKMGWIYDVMTDTHYITQKGQGTTKNGQKVAVRAPRKLEDPDAKGHMEARYFPKEMRDFLADKGIERFKSLHCAAHEYLNIASGNTDFAIFSHMKPWDHLAGVLMVQEAGGIVTKFDGSPYNITDEKGGIIVASHPDVLNQVQDHFIRPVQNIMRTIQNYKPDGA